jgi:hypothetical protein
MTQTNTAIAPKFKKIKCNQRERKKQREGERERERKGERERGVMIGPSRNTHKA